MQIEERGHQRLAVRVKDLLALAGFERLAEFGENTVFNARAAAARAGCVREDGACDEHGRSVSFPVLGKKKLFPKREKSRAKATAKAREQCHAAKNDAPLHRAVSAFPDSFIVFYH